jgi:hypothetical protein
MRSRRKCKAKKKNGGPCGADAQVGKDFCVFHDPERVQDGDRARRAGGIQRSRQLMVNAPANTPDLRLSDSNEVSAMLSVCMNQLRRGELDARVANAIGYLASVQLRCFEQGILQERITNVENSLGIQARKPIMHFEAVPEVSNDESPEKDKKS